MKYDPQIHHRRSIRLKGYDYSQAGAYFITICCQDRVCLFGKISDGKMILNDAGKIANECWLQIPEHFPNAILHEHIVMPNHVHGIIELGDANTARVHNAINTMDQNDAGDVGIAGDVGVQNFEPQRVQNFKSQRQQHNEFQKIIPRSIGSIIRGYKIGVTKWFRNNTEIQTVWQRNYYEHIIRNEQSYQIISNYIIDNPGKWNADKFYIG